MFPKIMNDENFFKKAAAHGEEPPLTPQNEHQRSGLRFARRVRLPRAVGLAGMFLPIASTLVSHPPPGWWWLVLVGWAFVWPHLAWQIASRAVDPLSREIYNLKTDAVLAGMWVGVMGVNVPLRISVGVAPLNPQMSHYREWLKSADLALYKAKKAGRNRTEVAA